MLFIADSVGVSDIEFAPGNPKIIYAATWRTERKPWTIITGGQNGGIYKSQNGGETWVKKARVKQLLAEANNGVSQSILRLYK